MTNPHETYIVFAWNYHFGEDIVTKSLHFEAVEQESSDWSWWVTWLKIKIFGLTF